MSKRLVEAWFRTLNELSNTFGPLKKRGEKLGVRLAKRFKKHGNVAKKRILRFVDIILSDTQLLFALELGDWRKALARLEVSIVKARVTDASTGRCGCGLRTSKQFTNLRMPKPATSTVEQMHKGIAMMVRLGASLVADTPFHALTNVMSATVQESSAPQERSQVQSRRSQEHSKGSQLREAHEGRRFSWEISTATANSR